MINPQELWRKLRYLANRKQAQRELDEELESHRAEMGDRAASFGPALKLREEANDAWGFGWFDRLWQDVHYGARILRNSPRFTLTAIAILTLGIGLNVTAFGFFNTLVLRPLAVKDPDTVALVLRAAPEALPDNLTYPSFDFYRRHNRVFSRMWALANGELLLESGEKVNARFVTPEFFREMGSVPSLGRLPGPTAGDTPGSVVVSDRFWKKQLGGDSSAIGRKVRLNQFNAVVGGVLPRNFISVEPQDLDVWIPMGDYPLYVPGTRLFTDPKAMWLRVYGRLLPGISFAAAENGLRPLVDEHRKEAPGATWDKEYLPVVPGAFASRLTSREAGVLIVPALLLLLVLAARCANLGNLLLARGAMRAREMGIRSAAGASRRRVVLVAVQVALSCILMILSGLMTRGVNRALAGNPGFSFEQSANIQLGLAEAGVRGPAARLFLSRFRSRISQVPGVEAVGLSNLPPLGNSASIMGHAVGNIAMHGVDGDYFGTMRIPILEGRIFTPSDPETNIIIGERLAKKLWPLENPLGKEFPLRDGKSHWTIVGVAANAPTVGLGDSDAMELYQPLVDSSIGSATVVVRTRNIAAVDGTLQKVANSGDGTITARVTPMREGFENKLRGGRLAAMSMSALGAVALLVAIVGLAGLISYTVTQRTKEIGIRMALGARPGEAMRVGFAQLLKPVGIGMMIGVATAAGLAQMLRFILYGLSTLDPIAYLSALTLFVLLVAMAAISPLLRAARVDPTTALRHD